MSRFSAPSIPNRFHRSARSRSWLSRSNCCVFRYTAFLDLHPSSINHTARARLESSSVPRHGLPSTFVEGVEVRCQRRKAPGHETIRDAVAVSGSLLGWCSHELGQLTVLPVNVAPLRRRMIDLEKRVGLAAHRTIAEKAPDDDRMLHFRQTSHGITHLTVPV